MRVYVITVLVAVLASVVQVAYAPVLPRGCEVFACDHMPMDSRGYALKAT